MHIILLPIFIILSFGDSALRPLPEVERIPVSQYILGEKLFRDNALSSDGMVSCNTCHDLERYGVDNLKHSVGANSVRNKINTPSIYNSGNSMYFFTSGSTSSLRSAISMELQNVERLNTTWTELIDRLSLDKEYVASFKHLYNEKISKENILLTLEQFIKSLSLGKSRFDEYLNGDVQLSEQEQLGYAKFSSYGCINCHNGENIGANTFANTGEFTAPEKRLKLVRSHEYGRYNATQRASDKYLFKVPSLRNVEHTYPYFNSGEGKQLLEVIVLKVKNHTGETISLEDAKLIEIFLKTLSVQKSRVNSEN